MTKEVLTLALKALEYMNVTAEHYVDNRVPEAAITAIKEALSQPEQEPVACVYKATTKKGETAHFGEYSAAKAWAGWGTVEQVPLKTLTLIQKSIQPCSTCEALSRAVMLDQTSHDNFKPDWDTQAVLVEEQQRMAKRIEDLEAMLERQTARIVGLQDEIRNLTGEE